MSMDELLKAALMLAVAEENARIVAEKLAGRVQVQVSHAPKTSSRVVRLSNFRVPGVIVDERGSGCLRELVIRSEGDGYVLTMYVDGFPLYSNSYGWFRGVSQAVEGVDAFYDEEHGLHVLRLSNIHFTESLKVIVEPMITVLAGQAVGKLTDVFCQIDEVKA